VLRTDFCALRCVVERGRWRHIVTPVPTTSDIFLTPILRGKRFEGHTVPVEVLADLAAYKELVLDVARAVYLKDNPGRKRVPKGFDDSFRLTLKQVDHGSAIPVLVIERDSELESDLIFAASEGVVGLDGVYRWYRESRDLIAECVSAVAEDREPPLRFPREKLPAFNPFGRHLLPDESIELAPNKETRGVIYNEKVRKKLVLLRSSTYERPLEMVGTAIEIHAENASFMLRTQWGSYTAPYPVHLEATVLQAIAERQTKVVRIAGMGVFDQSERLQRITDVGHIELVDSAASEAVANIIVRLNAMGEMRPGWLDGDGVPPTPQTIQVATDVLRAIIDDEELPPPGVFPTAEGNILAEWQRSPWSVELRILAGSERIEVIADNLAENRDESTTIEASDHATSDLAAWLRPFLSATRRST